MPKFYIHDDNTVSFSGLDRQIIVIGKEDVMECARQFAINEEISLLDEELGRFLKAYQDEEDFMKAMEEKAKNVWERNN